MKVFFRAQLSSLLATIVDFALTICFVEIGTIHYTLAVVIGAIGGAFANFLINRYWSFNAAEKPVGMQGLRYGLVWTGSLLLNVTGIYGLTHFLSVHYIISKIIIAVVVGIAFNYTLQKEYVFNTNEKSHSQ